MGKAGGITSGVGDWLAELSSCADTFGTGGSSKWLWLGSGNGRASLNSSEVGALAATPFHEATLTAPAAGG
jgi:hypothetical protein